MGSRHLTDVWALGFNAVRGFWIAYVFTRPLGVSCADWLGVSHAHGGLALGPGPVALVRASLVVAVVCYAVRAGLDASRLRPAEADS